MAAQSQASAAACGAAATGKLRQVGDCRRQDGLAQTPARGVPACALGAPWGGLRLPDHGEVACGGALAGYREEGGGAVSLGGEARRERSR